MRKCRTNQEVCQKNAKPLFSSELRRKEKEETAKFCSSRRIFHPILKSISDSLYARNAESAAPKY